MKKLLTYILSVGFVLLMGSGMELHSAVPTVTSYNTSTVCEQDNLIITGTGFITANAVTINGIAVPGGDITINNATSITVVVPSGSGPLTSTADKVIVTNPDGSNTTSPVLTINTLPVVSFSGLASEYCIDASPVTLTGSPADASGVFSGPGITDNGNGTASFDPAVATAGGPYDITYTYTDGNGCENSETQMVTVNDLPSVSFSGLASNYCENDGIVALTGTPSGGTFSGTGVTDGSGSSGTFDPAAATVGGPYNVTYTYTDGNGCTNSETQQVSVGSAPTAGVTVVGGSSDLDICEGENITIELSGAGAGEEYRVFQTSSLITPVEPDPVPGTTFQPNTAPTGDGSYWVQIFSSGGGCESSSPPLEVAYTVNPAPTISLTSNPAPATICEGSNITFTEDGADPDADTWEFFVNGSPVQGPDNNNQFSTTTLSDGDDVKVRVVDVNGCFDETPEINVTVETPAQITIDDIPGSACVVDGGFSISLEATVSGGSINNNARWDVISGTGLFGNFSPTDDPHIDNSVSSPNTVDVNYFPTYTDVSNDSVVIQLSTKDQGVCSAFEESVQRTIILVTESSPSISTSDYACPRDTIFLEGVLGEGGFNPVWTREDPAPSTSAGFGDPNSLDTYYIPMPSDTANGTITIQLDQSGGACGSSPSQKVITFLSTPNSGTITGLTQVCALTSNTKYEVTGATPLSTFKWIVPDSTGTISIGESTNSIGIDFLDLPGDHPIGVQAISLGGCIGDTSTVLVTINRRPSITPGSNKTSYSVDDAVTEIIVNDDSGDPITGNDIENLLVTGPGVIFDLSNQVYKFDPEAAGINGTGEFHLINMTYTDPVTACESFPVGQEFSVYDPENFIDNLDPEYCVYDDKSLNLNLTVAAPEEGVSYRNYSQQYGYPTSWYGGDLLYATRRTNIGIEGPGIEGDPLGTPDFDPSVAGVDTFNINYNYTEENGWRVRVYDDCYYFTFVCDFPDPFFPGNCLVPLRKVCTGGAYTGDTIIYPGIPEYYPPVTRSWVSEKVIVYPRPAIPVISDFSDGLADDQFNYCITEEVASIKIQDPQASSTFNWFESDQTTPIVVSAANDTLVTGEELGFTGLPNTPGTYEFYVQQDRFKHDEIISPPKPAFDGCQSFFKKVSVVVYPTPDPPVLQPFASDYCEGDNLETIRVDNPQASEVFKWYEDDGAGQTGDLFINDASSYSPDFSEVIEGDDTTFFVTRTENIIGLFEGCESDVTEIQLSIYEYPEVTFTGLAEQYCVDYGQTVNLNGLPTGSGGVFEGDGVTDQGLGVGQFSVTEAAAINDTLTDVSQHEISYSFTDNGCTSTETKTVTINPLPVPDIISITEGQEFCLDPDDEDPHPLIGQVNAVAPIVAETFSTFKKGPIGEQYLKEFLGEDIITYTVLDENGCINSISKSILVNALPDPDFTMSSRCNLVDIAFENLTTISEGSVDSYSWNFGEGPIVTEIHPVYKYSASGQYNLILSATSDKGCSNQKDSLITIGSFPNLNFNWAGVCEGGITQFTGIKDQEVEISDWTWDFDDNGSTAAIQSPAYQFSQAGGYSVSLTAESRFGCIETKTQRVVILPTFDLTSDYTEDFEQDLDSWIPGDVFITEDTVTWSWQSVQSGSSHIPGHENNGSAFWSTAANPDVENDGSFYYNNEHSAMNSPCFSLLNFEKPMISFDIYKDIEAGSDGVTFQYSTDGGATWRILGEENQGDNWFDNRGILGLTGFDIEGNTNAWTGTDQNWYNAKFNLDFLGQEAQVRFRFALGTNEANFGGPFSGFAFDNIFIGDRNRKVLIEQFVNRNVSSSLVEENYVDDMTENDNEYLTIKYHTSFPQNDRFSSDNNSEPSSRSLIYGVSEIPMVFLDGKTENASFAGVWGNSESERRILYRSPFRLDIETPQTDDGGIGIRGTVRALMDFDKSFKVYFAILEDSVNNSGNVTKNILRKFLPDVSGIEVEKVWNAGDTETFDVSYDLKEVWNPVKENINIIMFLQDPETLEIYQAESYRTPNDINKVLGLPENLIRNNVVSIYPNPIDDYFNLRFDKETVNSYYWYIIDQRGIKLNEGKIEPEIREIQFDSRDYPSGINHLVIGNDTGEFYTFKLIIIH